MTTTPHDKALTAFTDYFVRNYPGPDTVIFDPKWHAPKLFNAVMQAIEAAGGIVCAREPAEHQRLVPGFGWQRVNDEDVPHYSAKGFPRRTLHIPIEAGNAGDGWRDMSSAPKRGQILLALPNGVVREGYWGAASYNRRTKDYDYAWVTHPSSGDVKPTHWQSLPAPPSTPSNEGREKA